MDRRKADALLDAYLSGTAADAEFDDELASEYAAGWAAHGDMHRCVAPVDADHRKIIKVP